MEGNYKKWINRFNSKQDTLTEDNLGQLMDSELDTKSIPTSGDTILGRDALNGKAVKIPINKLAFKSDIDNLQIGGRNYFTKSNLEYGARSITTGQIVTASNTYIRTKEPISLEENKNYILTTINKGIGNWTYDILLIKWDGTFFGLIQTGKDAEFFVPQGVTMIHINIRDNGNPLNLEWFNANINVKIEKGNKATDWTPAPEDKADLVNGKIPSSQLPFNLKVTTPSSWVTGTTSETEVLRIEIPANSLSENDILKIPYLHISKLGSVLMQTRIKLSTSPTMPTGTTDQIAQYLNPPSTIKYIGMMRTYKIYDGQIWGYNFTDNGISDITTNINNGLSSKPFNRSETNYLYVSLKLGDSADQSRLEGIQITNS